MPTKNLVPRLDGEGKLGVTGESDKRWGEVNSIVVTANTITAQNFSTPSGEDFITAGSFIGIETNLAGQLVISAESQPISALSDISDVTAYTISSNGKFLKYSHAEGQETGTWSAEDIPQINNLSDVSNVNTPSLADSGKFLKYNHVAGQETGTWSAEDIPQINNLSDITDVGTYTNQNNAGHVLIYNGATWVPQAIVHPWRETTIENRNFVTTYNNTAVQVPGNIIELFDLGDLSTSVNDKTIDGGSITGPVSYTADCGIISQDDIF